MPDVQGQQCVPATLISFSLHLFGRARWERGTSNISFFSFFFFYYTATRRGVVFSGDTQADRDTPRPKLAWQLHSITARRNFCTVCTDGRTGRSRCVAPAHAPHRTYVRPCGAPRCYCERVYVRSNFLSAFLLPLPPRPSPIPPA